MKVHVLIVGILTGILPMLIFNVGFLNTYVNTAITNKINEIEKHGNILATRLDLTGYMSNPTLDEINNEIEHLTDIYTGKSINARVIIVNQNLSIIKDSFSSETNKTLISENVIKCLKGDKTQYVDRKNQYVELTLPIANTNKDIVGVLYIRFSIENIYAIHDTLQDKMAILIMVITIFVIIATVFFSKKITKPLKSIATSMDRLFEGYMQEEVSIKGYYESEKISASFNQMMARMKKLEDSRQEFVSNVSHELKTPITSVKVLAESLLSQDNVPIELYREFLVDINDEIERENKIINDLLALVKLDKTAGDMHISCVNINDLLEQIMKRLKPIANKRGIEMIFESFRQVTAEVDEVKMSLAISNLIENAIKYNKDEGWIRVSLNADHKYFYVKVADSGVGIPEDSKDLIFERFYRVDKARSRETGGTGLGLSIARNAIHMHRGAIKVYSKLGEGATFTVRIPISYIV